MLVVPSHAHWQAPLSVRLLLAGYPAMSVFIYGDGVLRMAGTGAVAAVLIGGLLAAVAGYLYAELGAAFPQAGGVYPSLVGVLGPFWAFPYITMMMLAAPTVTAFGLLGFADYVRVLAPGGATLRIQAFNGGGQILIPASWNGPTRLAA